MENHVVTLENRERITINQVLDVDAFDEQNLWANIKEGTIIISGEKLNIEKLDLKEGTLVVSGTIYAFSYGEKKTREKRKFIHYFKKP